MSHPFDVARCLECGGKLDETASEWRCKRCHRGGYYVTAANGWSMRVCTGRVEPIRAAVAGEGRDG